MKRLILALPLALAMCQPALARDWYPVTAAQNALAQELTGRPGPFAVPLPDSVPTMIGTIAAADLIDAGCKRVPGKVDTAAITLALDHLRREAAGRNLNVNFTVERNSGDFAVILAAQLVKGCPATAPTQPGLNETAIRARVLDELKALLRAAIDGVQ